MSIFRSFWAAKQILIVAAIIASSSILSILTLSHFDSTSSQIASISSEEARSNARIQLSSISESFSNKLEQLTGNVAIIASTPAIKDGEFERAVGILNAAQKETEPLTGAYMWQDSEGRVIWATVYVNEDVRARSAGLTLDDRPYFVTPKNTLQPHFGEQIESRDGVHRVHISYPVLADVETASGKVATEFNGVVSTAFSLADMGKELESELSSELKGRLGIIDTAGTIIYAPGQDFAGLNIFGEEYQTAISRNVIPEEQIGRWNEQLRASLESGKRGWGDFSISGITTTSAYQPIIINGRHVMTFYLELPHTMTAQTAALIEQQKNFSIISVIAIAGVSLALAIAVLKWNTRLQSTISQRTDDLAKKSEALQTSNQLLIESNKELELRNQELVAARKLAEDHEKTQKEFINIAAHELRTPIQPLVGIAEMLGAKLRDDSTESIPITRPEIEIIVRNTNRLMNLSSDILAVSRIESSSLNLNKEEIDLEEKVRSVVDDMRHFISDGKKVEVRFVSKVPREELPFMVEADRERIFQVLANLLSNARKFTEAGQIVVTVVSKDGDAVVSVMDTGSGIDRDIFPKLFTKFATKSQRGTGLGLFISKSIVEAHGGRIWAENNKDGKGASFSFTLPVLKKQLPAPNESRRE